jgi:hypothetical protein
MLLKYYLKLIVSAVFFFIKKYTPYGIQIKLRAKLALYPTVLRFLNLARHWVKDAPNPKKLVLEFLLSFIVRRLFLPMLKAILNKPGWKMITLKTLKCDPKLRAHFKEFMRKNNVKATNPLENSTFSNSMQQIYCDLQKSIRLLAPSPKAND